MSLRWTNGLSERVANGGVLGPILRFPTTSASCLRRTSPYLTRIFPQNGQFKVFALRALSKILCLSTIGITVTIILIKKALAINTFSSGFRGKVLAHVGICNAKMIHLRSQSPYCLESYPQAKKRKVDMVEKICVTDPPS